MKQAILELLEGHFGHREFDYSEASTLVKAQFQRGSSTTRRILLLGMKDGLVRRVKNGIYSFVNPEAVHETTLQEVAPIAMQGNL